MNGDYTMSKLVYTCIPDVCTYTISHLFNPRLKYFIFDWATVVI